MPNWCINHTRFEGKEENISTLHKRLTENATARTLNTWWIELEPAESGGREDWPLFARTLKFEDLGAHCTQAEYGYYESIACIGSKWDPQFLLEEVTPTSISLVYDSAWSPTLRGLVLVACKYGVNLRVEFAEPGCDFAGVLTYDTATEHVAYYSTTYLHWRWLEQDGGDNVVEFIKGYYGDDGRLDELIAESIAESASWPSVESIDDMLTSKHDVTDWLEQELRTNTLPRL